MTSPVRLVPHDSLWAAQASAEAMRLMRAFAIADMQLHHIGSTAIPGIAAKPVIDLLGVVRSLALLDARCAAVTRLGYAARGEHGLPGRRYFTLSDGDTGTRRVHLHVYADGDPAIERHIVFRDRLRANPDLARAYESEKIRCAIAHPDDRRAYTACKGGWIDRVLTKARAQHD